MSMFPNQSEAAIEYAIDRRNRAEALWARFIRLEPQFAGDCPTTVNWTFRRIRAYLSRGYAPGWYWRSVLEYADVADQKGPPLPQKLRLVEPQPVAAMAGSEAKVMALADRAASGQYLFCSGDGPGVIVGEEEPRCETA